MPDITTVWQGAFGDWQMAGAALLAGNDLETAALISLFTDAEAGPDDEIPDGTDDARGWWGDQGETYPIGSKLWLLERSKKTPETLAKAKDYIAAALQWMIDDGVIAGLDILTEWDGLGFLAAQITFHQPNGVKLTRNFSWAWAGVL
ncbi:MAG TPA: phage GP46 family protein [Bradyrhizobium sp.]|nr:phage GP46 family protein [Bradyrhizobium sp.]